MVWEDDVRSISTPDLVTTSRGSWNAASTPPRGDAASGFPVILTVRPMTDQGVIVQPVAFGLMGEVTFSSVYDDVAAAETGQRALNSDPGAASTDTLD
jgi:hypothetical protein